MAGLDYQPILIPPESMAVNKSLIELDLRSHTGATIVAISRAGQTIALPPGEERLQAGDMLAISGSPPALERARAALGLAPAPLRP